MRRALVVLTALLVACSDENDDPSLAEVVTLDPSGPTTPTNVRGRVIFPDATRAPERVALSFFSFDSPETVVERVRAGDGVDYAIVGLYRTGVVAAAVDFDGDGELSVGEWVGYGGGTPEMPLMSAAGATSLMPSVVATELTVDIPLGVITQCLATIGSACTSGVDCRSTTCNCPQGGYVRYGGQCEDGLCVGLSAEACSYQCNTAEVVQPVEGSCYEGVDAKAT